MDASIAFYSLLGFRPVLRWTSAGHGPTTGAPCARRTAARTGRLRGQRGRPETRPRGWERRVAAGRAALRPEGRGDHRGTCAFAEARMRGHRDRYGADADRLLLRQRPGRQLGRDRP